MSIIDKNKEVKLQKRKRYEINITTNLLSDEVTFVSKAPDGGF